MLFPQGGEKEKINQMPEISKKTKSPKVEAFVWSSFCQQIMSFSSSLVFQPCPIPLFHFGCFLSVLSFPPLIFSSFSFSCSCLNFYFISSLPSSLILHLLIFFHPCLITSLLPSLHFFSSYFPLSSLVVPSLSHFVQFISIYLFLVSTDLPFHIIPSIIFLCILSYPFTSLHLSSLPFFSSFLVVSSL